MRFYITNRESDYIHTGFNLLNFIILGIQNQSRLVQHHYGNHSTLITKNGPLFEGLSVNIIYFSKS